MVTVETGDYEIETREYNASAHTLELRGSRTYTLQENYLQAVEFEVHKQAE